MFAVTFLVALMDWVKLPQQMVLRPPPPQPEQASLLNQLPWFHQQVLQERIMIFHHWRKGCSQNTELVGSDDFWLCYTIPFLLQEKIRALEGFFFSSLWGDCKLYVDAVSVFHFLHIWVMASFVWVDLWRALIKMSLDWIF